MLVSTTCFIILSQHVRVRGLSALCCLIKDDDDDDDDDDDEKVLLSVTDEWPYIRK